MVVLSRQNAVEGTMVFIRRYLRWNVFIFAIKFYKRT